MFVDEIKVEVYGGRGGHGLVAARREKYVEYGGPWGGSGGNGGSVIFVGDEGKSTLMDLRYMRHIKAQNGENGKTKGQHGANGSHVYVKVPLGTIVFNEDKSKKIGEIISHQQELVVAIGGRGNMALATQSIRYPDYAEKGDLGETHKITVELKMLADVGLIGYPSVGKSTLISVISNARPKIADYPFTTLYPHLGMVRIQDESFVVADLPGLIEDAHKGLGLGIRFLKHIERCRVFLHVLDLTRDDPYQDYLAINHELEMYDPKLLERPQLVVLNKSDCVENQKVIDALKEKISHPMVIISALEQTHLDTLLYKTSDMLKVAPKIVEETPIELKDYIFQEEGPGYEIIRTADAYEVTGDKLKVLFERTDFTRDEAVKRFARQLRAMGVDDALREKGAQNGDTIRIFTYEFEFID